MKNQLKPESRGVTIWDQPEPDRKGMPSPLTRAKILRAALVVADAQGLENVSLRNVGAALKAGPMRLYAYISTKEDLLDLMVDEIYAEIKGKGPLPNDWREAMRTNAIRLREIALLHPWFLSLIGGRPHQGPHALDHLESLLAVLYRSGAFPEIDSVMQALKTIQAYIIGALQSEASEMRETRASGLSKQAWQEATADRLFRVIATGRIPTIAKVVDDADHPPPEAVFKNGLSCVLEGVAANLCRNAKNDKRVPLRKD